jgi:hypothetical protein
MEEQWEPGELNSKALNMTGINYSSAIAAWRRHFVLILVGIGTAFFGSASQAQIVINEVMADNQGAVENGSSVPDYIELYNASGSPVTIGNMRLTDDPAVPSKYVIPAGTSIPANGFRIFWCDANYIAPGLHTGFGLGANTDRVQLYGTDGFTLLDDVAFGISVGNFSIGRIPNGNGAWALNQPTPLAANVAQPLGSNSQLRLNEWMASPGAGLEDWIEVYNGSSLPVELHSLVLTDLAVGTPANRAIPALSFIGAHGYVQFFASDLAEDDADHLDFRLGSGGETLSIYNSDRATLIDRVVFGSQSTGISQGRAPDGSDNIIFFPPGGASPEAPNQVEITNVAISEVLSHTDPPLEDAIELQNLTGAPVDISYWWLSDSASDLKRYQIPAGTILPAYGFKVFYQNQFDAGLNAFSLNSAEGDEVVLSSGNSAGQLTGQQTFMPFGPLKNGVSIGRHLTSVGADFVPLKSRTFGVDTPTTLTQFRTGTGRTNAAPRVGPVVISEVHYQPLGGAVDLDEFIELHNFSASSVPLYDVNYPTNSWRLRSGITFDFPLDTSIPAGGYLLVVSFDPVLTPSMLTDFRARFGVPPLVPVLGPFSGRLSNSGEEARLLHPDRPEGLGDPTPGLVPYELVEFVKYGIAAPWPVDAAGTGASLQRSVATNYSNEPLNWFAATPNPGRGAVADSDGDGMPDDWETANGLDPESNADADDDADDDGASNLAEYRAGTNPQSSSSVLKFTSVQKAENVLSLKFHAVAGRPYELQARSQLAVGNWLTISNIPPPGGTGEITLSVPANDPAMQFYRVVLSETP